jgi:hypothetical protein
VIQVPGELNQTHRSSKQSVDLLKVEYTLIDGSGPEQRNKAPILLSVS